MRDSSSPAVAAPFDHGQPSAPAIKIDKGIPIPPPKRRGLLGGRKLANRFPWRSMDVGDSFVFPRYGDGPDATKVQANSHISAVHRRGRERFETRLVEEDGQRVVRVWRVS